MSWKSAERRPSPPGLSITGRLVILFTVAAVLILSVSSGILYVGLAKSLEERSRHYLRDEVNMLRAMLGKPDGLEEVQREIAAETGTLEYVQHYVRVLDKEGNVLIETPGMDRLIPISSFPKAKKLDDAPYGQLTEWETPDGQTYMLKALCTSLGDPPGRGRLQVALNATRREMILAEYRDTLLLVGLVGVFASMLAAVLISHRGLLPLRKITALTRRVSATHLDERLQAHQWPKELHDLAGSYDLTIDRGRVVELHVVCLGDGFVPRVRKVEVDECCERRVRRRLGRVQPASAPDRDQHHVDRAQRFDLRLGRGHIQVAEVGDAVEQADAPGRRAVHDRQRRVLPPVRHDGAVSAAVARAGLELFEVDDEGLDKLDLAILSTIVSKFGGGPVGLSTLAAAVGEETDTVEDVVEPYLLQLGLLQRTPRGRVATERAYRHLGVTPEGALPLG